MIRRRVRSQSNSAPRFLGALGAVSIVVAISSVAPVATASTTAATIDYESNLPLNYAAGVQADQMIQQLANTSNYGGLQVTGSGIELDLTTAPTAVDQAAISTSSLAASSLVAAVPGAPSSGGVPVSIKLVQRSWQSLVSEELQIQADLPYLASQGAVISTIEPDITSNTVRVTLAAPDSVASNLLSSRYGDIVTLAPGVLNLSGSSRQADSVPWYGGDHITRPIGGGQITNCTSWFSAHSASSDRKSVV